MWILPRKPLADVRGFWKYHIPVQFSTEQLPDCSKLYVFCAKETNHSATGSVKTSSLTPALWSTVHTASQYVHFSKKGTSEEKKLCGASDLRLLALKKQKNFLRFANEIQHKGVVSVEKYCNATTLAQLFGVTVRRIQQMTADGIIRTEEKTGSRKKYNLEDTIKTYIMYLSDKAYGTSNSDKEHDLKAKKLEAEIALKESQGELHRLRTDIASGKYVSVEEVHLDYQKFFTVLKKFCLAIPTRVGGLISGYLEPVTARGIEKELSSEITSMLNAFIIASHKSEEPKRGRPSKKAGSS